MVFVGALVVTAALLLSRSTSAVSLAGIDYIFALGDSYSADAWDPSRGLDPIVGQDLVTTSGSYTWIKYLAANTGATNEWYDLATPGASSDAAIVYTGDGVPSLVDQAAAFQNVFPLGSSPIPWSSANTLFSLWIGVNDIGFSHLNGQFFPSLVDALFSSFSVSVGRLYASGARRFLFLNVPPTDQTPLIQTSDAGTVLMYQANIALWNTRLAAFVQTIPTLFPGSTTTLFDTHALFTSIIAAPANYGLAPSVSKTWCLQYAAVVADPSISLPECGVPMSQYLWFNAYHPTFTVQNLIAQGVAAALTASPNRKVKRVGAQRIDGWH